MSLRIYVPVCLYEQERKKQTASRSSNVGYLFTNAFSVLFRLNFLFVFCFSLSFVFYAKK